MTDEQLRWATGNRSLSVSPNNKFKNVDLPAEVSPAKNTVGHLNVHHYMKILNRIM